MTQDFKPRRADDKNPAHPPKKTNAKLVLGFGMLAGIGLAVGAMSFLGMTPATVTQKQAKPERTPPLGAAPGPATGPNVQVVQEQVPRQGAAPGMVAMNDPQQQAAAMPPGAAMQQSGAPLPLPGKAGDPAPEKRFQYYDILRGNTEAVPSGNPADAGKLPGSPARPDKAKTAKDKAAAEREAALAGFRDSERPDNSPAAAPAKVESKPVPAKPVAVNADVPKKETAKPETAAEHKPASSGKPIVLQAGAFSNAADADNQKARLAMMGIEAKVQPVQVQDKTLYRVRFGAYNQADEAARAQSELQKSGIATTVIR